MFLKNILIIYIMSQTLQKNDEVQGLVRDGQNGSVSEPDKIISFKSL